MQLDCECYTQIRRMWTGNILVKMCLQQYSQILSDSIKSKSERRLVNFRKAFLFILNAFPISFSLWIAGKRLFHSLKRMQINCHLQSSFRLDNSKKMIDSLLIISFCLFKCFLLFTSGYMNQRRLWNNIHWRINTWLHRNQLLITCVNIYVDASFCLLAFQLLPLQLKMHFIVSQATASINLHFSRHDLICFKTNQIYLKRFRAMFLFSFNRNYCFFDCVSPFFGFHQIAT